VVATQSRCLGHYPQVLSLCRVLEHLLRSPRRGPNLPTLSLVRRCHGVVFRETCLPLS